MLVRRFRSAWPLAVVALVATTPSSTGCDDYDWCSLYRGESRSSGQLTVIEHQSVGTLTHTFNTVYVDDEGGGIVRIRACSHDSSGRLWRADLSASLPTGPATAATTYTSQPLPSASGEIAGDLHYCQSGSCSSDISRVITTGATGSGTVTVDTGNSSIDLTLSGTEAAGSWTYDISAQLSR